MNIPASNLKPFPVAVFDIMGTLIWKRTDADAVIENIIGGIGLHEEKMSLNDPEIDSYEAILRDALLCLYEEYPNQGRQIASYLHKKTLLHRNEILQAKETNGMVKVCLDLSSFSKCPKSDYFLR